MKKQTIWIVTGHSESGDDYVTAFSFKPTDEDLYSVAHSWDGDESEEGPGDYGSYVALQVTEITLDEAKTW